MEHFVSASCRGEICGMCHRKGRPHVAATHKVGEEIPHDDPFQERHNYTQYVCCRHFRDVLGQAVPCPVSPKEWSPRAEA